MRLREILSSVLLMEIVPLFPLSYAEDDEKRPAPNETTVSAPVPDLHDELPIKKCKRGTTPMEDYWRAQQEFDTICEHSSDMVDTAFDDIIITDIRSFFLTLIVCAHAVSIGNETLRDKMLAKLNERENLVKFPMLLGAFQNVFCDSRSEGCLSNVAIIAHRCEVVVALRAIYSVLKSRPKIPNYEEVKRMYLNYYQQVKSLS